MQATAESKEFKAALFHIGFMLSVGALFVLLGLSIPGISPRNKVLCWQTAMVGFFAAGVLVRRHPVVWYPTILRWANRLSQKPKPAPPASY
uniref:PGG domain-containing protein n=1 Tax=Arundo donax TaxID=35708 RepID=A0A0A9C746_ARUDO